MLDPHLCWLCPHLMCFLTTFSMSDIVWRWLPQVLANCADKGTAAGRLSPGKMGIFYPQNGYFHRQNDEKAPNVVADFQTNPPVSVLWRNTDKWICEQWSWSDPPTMNNGLLLVSPLQNLQAQHWFFLSIPTQRDFGCEPLGGLPQKPPRQRQLLGFFEYPQNVRVQDPGHLYGTQPYHYSTVNIYYTWVLWKRRPDRPDLRPAGCGSHRSGRQAHTGSLGSATGNRNQRLESFGSGYKIGRTRFIRFGTIVWMAAQISSWIYWKRSDLGPLMIKVLDGIASSDKSVNKCE